MIIAAMTYTTKHQRGRSALSLALERGDVDIIKVLIEGGADVNTQNKVIMCMSLHYTSLVLRPWCAPAQKQGLVTLEGLTCYII